VDQKAFDLIKSRFTKAPIVAHYDPNKPCIVETNSSDYVTSGILAQPDDNKILHPVAFISAKMTLAECNFESMTLRVKSC
jgi:hypothetical protein